MKRGYLPVVCCLFFQVTRQEHDGERRYTVEETDIHVEGEQMDERFPREDFGTVAAMILDTLKRERNEEVEAPEGGGGLSRCTEDL